MDTLFRTDEVVTSSVSIGNPWAADPLAALAGPLHPFLDMLTMPGQPCLIYLAQKGLRLYPLRDGGRPRTVLHGHDTMSPQQLRMRRRCAASHDSALKAHDKLAVQAFLDLYSCSRVTEMVRRGKQLKGELLESTVLSLATRRWCLMHSVLARSRSAPRDR